MARLISITVVFFICTHLNAQYKNDNVLYKTVYPEDLAQQLKANPGYLLLDVRSQGENEDTSSMGLNIGRFKNAKNIDVRQLGARLNELQGFKNTPVFVYCSHSQRSRRASKMLADSGFTKVYNINGGMTALVQTNSNLNDIYETKNNYRFLSPAEFCSQLINKNTLVIDVRNDSSYNAVTVNEVINSMGKIKNAVHIPLSGLENSLASIPKDKAIIVVDEFGDGSVKGATLLHSKGYNNVGILFDGMMNLITTNTSELACKNSVWQQNRSYHILTPDEFNSLMKQNTNSFILDIRNTDEFNNQSKDSWKNIGHLKNAVNIPVAELNQKLPSLLASKNKPIVLYSFTRAEVYNAAAILASNGFTDVNILAGGIFTLRWRAANIKGKAGLKDWVTDIPADNL